MFILTLSENLNKWIERILFGMLVTLAIVITMQVIFRFFFTALSWSEELSRFLLVWASMFGASIGFKRGSHIAITFLIKRLPKKLSKIICILSSVIQAAFFLIVAYYGVILMEDQGFQTSPAMGIHMNYIYSLYPIIGIIILIHLIASIIRTVRE